MKRTPAPPPGRGNKDIKSRVIAARLHPDYEDERAALAVYDEHVLQGYAPRDILTAALLAMADKQPKVKRSDKNLAGVLDSIGEKIDALGALWENAIPNLLRDLKRSDPKGLQQFADGEEAEGEFSEDFIRNARQAAKRSFRQTHTEDE